MADKKVMVRELRPGDIILNTARQEQRVISITPSTSAGWVYLKTDVLTRMVRSDAKRIRVPKPEPYHDNLRDNIGQALSDIITADKDGRDWFDAAAIDELADAVMQTIWPSGEAPFRVAEFWSSSRLGQKVRLLVEGPDIQTWGERGDFIRWVL